MESTKKEYKTIDVEGLAIALAEAAWKEDTKNVHVSDLYDIESYIDANGQMKVKKEVRPYWANNFFSIKDNYFMLICQFAKEEQPEEPSYATGKEEAGNRN
jgi:hypothetical protein